jgi:hypothetical protein
MPVLRFQRPFRDFIRKFILAITLTLRFLCFLLLNHFFFQIQKLALRFLAGGKRDEQTGKGKTTAGIESNYIVRARNPQPNAVGAKASCHRGMRATVGRFCGARGGTRPTRRAEKFFCYWR